MDSGQVRKKLRIIDLREFSGMADTRISRPSSSCQPWPGCSIGQKIIAVLGRIPTAHLCTKYGTPHLIVLEAFARNVASMNLRGATISSITPCKNQIRKVDMNRSCNIVRGTPKRPIIFSLKTVQFHSDIQPL